MLTRKLGRSGIEVSAMGLGGWAIGGPFNRLSDEGEESPMGWGQVDDIESIWAIHAAMDLGITLFDTANNYGCGHSEEVLGKAFNDRRNKVIIATKFGSLCDEQRRHVRGSAEPGSIRSSLEGSLRRLQTDYIDLYQFHMGSHPVEEAGPVRKLMEDLVKEGKIRGYGWSTDDPDRARFFAEGENCIAVQFSLNVINDVPEMIALLDEFNIAGLNKHPLASGSLTGKFHDDYVFPEDDLRHEIDWKSERGQRRLKLVAALRDVLTSGGRTMAQGAIAWIWARDSHTIPIPGFKNVQQATENAKAMEFGPLTAEQFRQVEEIMGRIPEMQ